MGLFYTDQFKKKLTKPNPGSPDTFYYILVDDHVESYLTDNLGNLKNLGNTDMINKVIDERNLSSDNLRIVSDINERNTLVANNDPLDPNSELPEGGGSDNPLTRDTFVLVLDASDDSQVNSGFGLYAYTHETQTFLLISHTHSNKLVLDKFSENNDGVLLYDDNEISSSIFASLTGFVSEASGVYLYSGYILNGVPKICRYANSVKVFAQNLTNLEADWVNKENLTYS